MLNNILSNIINNEKDKLINKGINHLIGKCMENINIEDDLNKSLSKKNDEKGISISIKF